MKLKGKAVLAGLLSAILLLYTAAGCAQTQGTSSSAVSEVSTEKPLTVEYTEEDLDAAWSESGSTSITLSGNTATAAGSGAAVKDSTVTISAAGTYVLSGTLTDGQIAVSAGKGDLVRLVLNGVTLSNSTSAPIYSSQAGKTVIVLAEGSKNTVTDATEYKYESADDDEPDAAIFSKDDLTINGTGSLTVTGNYKNGIGSKDTLKIVSGTISVTAANDGIRGRDAVAVKDGTITVDAKGDAVRSNNDEDTTKGWIAIEGGTFQITSGQDALQAETILQVTGGTFDITAGGGSANAAAHQEQFDGQGGGFGGGRPNGNGGFQPGGDKSSTSSGTASGAASGTQAERPNVTPPAESSAGTATKNVAASLSSNTAESQTAQPDQSGSSGTAESTEEDSTSTKALKGGSEVYLSGGTFQIDSADDAVHSNGTVIVAGGNLNISTGDDGMHADDALVIQDGTIEIQKSYEGLEGASVTISGGTIHVTASDDGINAAGGSDDDTDSRDSFQANDSNEIRFTGGTVVIDASGDGVDSNGNVVQEGGTVLVNGPVNSGNGALDFGGTYQISGGILVAAGSSGMAQAPDEDSQQNSLTVIFTETQAAGTAVNISDAAGNSILTFAPTKQFQTIVVSAPGLKQGSSYTVSTGGENNDMNEDGYAASGTYSGGTQLTKVTLSGASTVISSTGEETTLGGMGGMGGGGRPNRNDGQDAGGSGNGGTPPDLGSGAPADAGGGPNGRTQQSGSASSAS